MTKINYNQNYFYVSAIPGAGKTYALLDYLIKSTIYGDKHIIVQPTTALINQTYNDLIDKQAIAQTHRKIIKITNETTNNVVKDIIEVITSKDSDDFILLISQMAFNITPFSDEMKSEITIIFDEYPSVIQKKHLRLKYNHNLLTDNFEFVSPQAKYSKLKAIKGREKEIDQILDSKEDDIYKVISPIIALINSPNVDLWIEPVNFNLLKTNQKTDDYSIIARIYLKPEAFRDWQKVIFMGADFDDTILKKTWENEGDHINFTIFKPIQSKLRWQTHRPQPNLKIIYAFDDYWSAEAANKTIFAETTGYDLLLAEAIKQMANSDYIYTCNKAKYELTKTSISKGQFVSTYAHGINEYQNINNAALLSHLNINTFDSYFYSLYDIDYSDIEEAVYFQIAYQFLMRTKIRTGETLADTKWFVPDRRLADWLASKIPSSKVIASPIADTELRKNGRPSTYNKGGILTKEETAKIANKAKCRKRNAIKQQIALEKNLKYMSEGPCMTIALDAFDTKNFDKAYGSPHNEDGRGRLLHIKSEDAITWLKAAHTERDITNKKENDFYIPARFNTNKRNVTTKKGIENIEYCFGIFLDNDASKCKSPMSVDRALQLLSHIKCCAYESSTSGNYRIFIPTDSIMTIKTREVIIKHIYDLLTDGGLYSHDESDENHHGFDKTARNPTQGFYGPANFSTNSNHFFKETKGDIINPIELLKKTSNPIDYIDIDQEIDEIISKRPKKKSKNTLSIKATDNTTKIEQLKQEIINIPSGSFTSSISSKVARMVSLCAYDGYKAEAELLSANRLRFSRKTREHEKDISRLVKKYVPGGQYYRPSPNIQ